jgi:mannose-1-phosphate guanylyltransferase
MKNTAEGNVVLEGICCNTHVINDIDMPVVVMGLEDSVVVASNDGILVAKKDQTSRLKDAIMTIENRPMYERKRWGKYRIIEGNQNSLTKKLILEPGKQISYQYHECRKEIWTIISGEGILYLDGIKSRVGVGDVVKISENMKHGIKAETEMEIIEVQIGNKMTEDDIVRIEMEW